MQAQSEPVGHRLIGLVLKRPSREQPTRGSSRAFPGRVINTSDLKTGTPVAIQPGVSRYWSLEGLTGSVSVHCEIPNLISNFYFSVAALKIV